MNILGILVIIGALGNAPVDTVGAVPIPAIEVIIPGDPAVSTVDPVKLMASILGHWDHLTVDGDTPTHVMYVGGDDNFVLMGLTVRDEKPTIVTPVSYSGDIGSSPYCNWNDVLNDYDWTSIINSEFDYTGVLIRNYDICVSDLILDERIHTTTGVTVNDVRYTYIPPAGP